MLLSAERQSWSLGTSRLPFLSSWQEANGAPKQKTARTKLVVEQSILKLDRDTDAEGQASKLPKEPHNNFSELES